MNGTTEAIYATMASILAVVGTGLIAAIQADDLSADYWLPAVFAVVFSFIMFWVAGTEARRR